jgi:uracil-DNA glycosylase
VNMCIGCEQFPCADVSHQSYLMPDVDVEPSKIRVAMVSEAPPSDPADYYYAPGDPLFARTTVQAFRDAGAQCSEILEKELALFPNLTAIALMGDVAIKSLDQIARRAKEGAVIPAGATYKIRSGQYSWRGRRVYPSYLQAGPAFFIEKSKRLMIAEDISAFMGAL